MNAPEYILVDVIGEIVNSVKAALNLSNLNYQYGYIKELNETLIQWSKEPETDIKRYPLVWLSQPFNIDRSVNVINFFGVADVDLFIINKTDKSWKAKDRMTNNYKPIIYPIYRQLMIELDNHVAISTEYGRRTHNFFDFYYWGNDQQTAITDIVDCSKLSGTILKINHNQNC